MCYEKNISVIYVVYIIAVLKKNYPEFTIGSTSTVIETINSLDAVIRSVVANER